VSESVLFVFVVYVYGFEFVMNKKLTKKEKKMVYFWKLTLRFKI